MGTRAGLFRVWAVSSVVWLGGVGFAGFQSFRQDAATNYIYAPGDPRRFVPCDPPPDGERFIIMDDGTRLYFPRSAWQHDEIPRVAEEFWEGRWLRYWSFLRDWLVLFAVPGVVFITIYAAIWISEGFRPGL